MSYRDPKIIVDRSAEILAQGANSLGQSMVNMFGSVVANEKKQADLRIARVNAIGQWAQGERDAADKKIARGAAKVAPGLTEQWIDNQTNKYNDVIKRQAQDRYDPTSTTEEDRKSLREDILRLKAQSASAGNMRAFLASDSQEVEDNKYNDGTLSPDFVWSSLDKRLESGALNNKTIDGITYEKRWVDGPNGEQLYEIDATIDPNTPMGKSILKGWPDLKIDKSTGKIHPPTIKGDPNNMKNSLTKVPEGMDQASFSIPNLIEKGVIKKNAFFEAKEFSKKDVSGGVTVTSMDGVFDIKSFSEKIKDTNAQHAAGVIGIVNPEVQLAYISSRLGIEMSPKEWEEKYPTVANKTDYITGHLQKKSLAYAKTQLKSRNATELEIANGIADDDNKVWYDHKDTRVADTQAEIQKTTEEGGARNSTILKNISSLIDTGVLNGKRYYDFTFQGTDDVNTQKYRIEPIPGDSEHVMVTQAHSNGSWKGVEPEKYPVTTLQKELGSSKKSSAKELTLEELKAKYTKQQ